MILVDSFIWVAHFNHDDRMVAELLADGAVLMHSLIIGELAMEIYHDRSAILADLDQLPRKREATHAEILRFIEVQGLVGVGIGYIDAALLAATKLTPGTLLWTRDRKLRAAARRLAVDARLDS